MKFIARKELICDENNNFIKPIYCMDDYLDATTLENFIDAMLNQGCQEYDDFYDIEKLNFCVINATLYTLGYATKVNEYTVLETKNIKDFDFWNPDDYFKIILKIFNHNKNQYKMSQIYKNIKLMDELFKKLFPEREFPENIFIYFKI